MVRSVGIMALVLSLAWTGLAGAQSSSPWGTPASPPRYIIVSEEGKTPQRCKVIQTWKDDTGHSAFQVQAVDSGEFMTIVGTSPQGGVGGSREMTTRIFRWGRDNKSPAGAPVPPSTTAASAQAPTLRVPTQMTSQTVRPVPVTTVSRSALDSLSTDTTNKPTPFTIAAKPDPLVVKKPESQTTMSMQVTQNAPVSDHGVLPPAEIKTNPTQPRLLPLASGNDGNQRPSDCACSTPCDNCGKPCDPCNPCGQPSCASATTSQPRQPLLGRLFKSNSSCSTSTTVVCQPTPNATTTPVAPPPPSTAVVQSATEQAKPGDWHRSWGNVEPWNTQAQASSGQPADLAKRADLTPAQMPPSTQPDPIQSPGQFHDIAMNTQLANSKMPQASRPTVITRLKDRMQSAKQPRDGATMANAPLPNGAMGLVPPGQPPIRVVEVEANEPNAFWAPQPPPGAEPKTNALSRDGNAPRQGVPPTIAGVPPSIPGVPPSVAGAGFMRIGPPGPTINPPRPPQAPYTRNVSAQPMSPDSGVPESMGNAFTLSGSRRPIPADFGGTPQETNGFDPMVSGSDGSPPRAYGMAMPAMPRPPMPYQAAMGPQTAVARSPLMRVPPVPAQLREAAFASVSDRPTGVPQLLATLKDALGPSQREAAAEKLSELNWQAQPLVVESLMKAARDDPAATVRAACVHALSHMGVNTKEAVALVRDLKSDRDPLVRQEAEEALTTLCDSHIQQASQK